MFTLVAIVVLFLVCNTIKVAINSYDMAHYTQVKFHFHRSCHIHFHLHPQILACQTFNQDSNFGYSQKNLTVTRIGKMISEMQFYF